MGSSRFAKSLTIATLASTLLTGCPFPIPFGYQGTSRRNLPESVPAFIRPGETSREDVMMHLGEPDSVAFDESWMSYGSVYCYGGLLFIAGGGSSLGGAGSRKMLYSRLILPFDVCGIVTQPIYETKSCLQLVGFVSSASTDKGGSSAPCLDIWGSDIPEKYGLSRARGVDNGDF